jgi:DNA-directed RNA polymerase subunit RPC12/RpoP
LDERRRALAREIHKGNTEQVDVLREVEARIASLKPPDVAQLEERAKQLNAVVEEAPQAQTDVACPRCSASATIFREQRSGYEVPCPRCTHKLIVKLKVDRD